MTGEYMNTSVENPTLKVMGTLPFGRGTIGLKLEKDHYPIVEEHLEDAVQPVTHPNTAQCIDGRERIELGDGTKDKDELSSEVYYQGPGGLVLPLTAAAVMSNSYVLRDSQSFSEAYEAMRSLVISLGYEPSKHEGCLAAAKVEDSFRFALSPSDTFGVISAVTETKSDDIKIIEENKSKQEDLLARGFFDGWDPEKNREFVLQNYPHNHAKLYHDDSATAGHNEAALVIVEAPGYGFNKNLFNEKSGMQAFGYTPSIFNEIASKIAVSKEEERKLQLALWQNLIGVSNIIISEDAELAVFK